MPIHIDTKQSQWNKSHYICKAFHLKVVMAKVLQLTIRGTIIRYTDKNAFSCKEVNSHFFGVNFLSVHNQFLYICKKI